MTTTLTVFPDTNLFLQCKPLGELDWSLIAHTGDVDVLITRPVQSELDALKAKGNSRQASRSRAASTLLAKLLKAPEDGLVLRTHPTMVRLKMALSLRADPSETEKLNYEIKDDQLVGIALAFHRTNSEKSVALVTYDHGPMFSAQSVNLPFKEIPEEWLLPPEQDEGARREAVLKNELEHLRNSEPKFEIRIEDATECAYEHTHNIFRPLSSEESEKLLVSVFESYPEANDFGPKDPSETVVAQHRLLSSLYGEEKETFTPATSDQIEDYKKRYVEWKEECRNYLQDIHEHLNKHLIWPTVTPLIANIGSRPADDALVELEAKGGISIERLSTDKGDAGLNKNEKNELPTFPRPPNAPQGIRKRIRTRQPFGGSLDALGSLVQDRTYIKSNFPSLHTIPISIDSNAFYWVKGTMDGIPVSKLSLTCQQWRHARKENAFTVGLRFRPEVGIQTGVLTVSVHAANLSNPVIKTWPIKIVVSLISPYEEVEALIEGLSMPTTNIQLG